MPREFRTPESYQAEQITRAMLVDPTGHDVSISVTSFIDITKRLQP